MSDEVDLFDVLYRMIETDRVFLQTLRFLTSNREQLLANQQRNMASLLSLLRSFTIGNAGTITIPLSIPAGVTLPTSWTDPVVVRPTDVQIARATTSTSVPPIDTNCSICQDSLMEPGTRITHCGHVFHTNCIAEWFTRSVVCPMCRHDIREVGHPAPTSSVPVNTTPQANNPLAGWIGEEDQMSHIGDIEESDEHHA
jgi:hypothetical protein